MVADRNRSLTQPQSSDGVKRALLFPGGGMRLSYQAGALLALQESGLNFQLMDATSGGSLNMSMLLSGLSPLEMCERWRTLKLRDSISFLPLEEYLDKDGLEALGSGDGFVEAVFPHLGIDLARIRAFDQIPCSYNLLDFGAKQIQVVGNQQMDEALLLAGMSLPGLFAPLRREGQILLDTGYVQDANVAEMVRRGAEELWIIWGLGNSAEYLGGPLHLYVQMLEMAANGALNRDMHWIDEINQGIARDYSPYGQVQPIRVHIIKPAYPLPLDPDLYLNKVDHATLVEMGYADAKQYLHEAQQSVDLRSNVSAMTRLPRGVRFQENISGTLQSPGGELEISMALTVHVEDLESFCRDALPQARITGRVNAEVLGGELLLADGRFQLLRDAEGSLQRRLIYELELDDGQQRYLLFAQKILQDDPGFDLWRDVTSMQVELYKLNDQLSETLAHGELRQGLAGFAKVMASVRATGGHNLLEETAQIARFGKFIMGEIYDAYQS